MGTKLLICLMLVGAAVVWGNLPATDAAAQGEVTLLGTLEEWKYPGADFGGASMSDGGNRQLQSVNCHAILTTGDPVEKVAKYYTDKFASGPDAPPVEAKGAVEAKGVDAQSVSTQDDSTGRGVQLRVISINRDKTSTTLVISRANGETKTHIAWSHYLRLAGPR